MTTDSILFSLDEELNEDGSNPDIQFANLDLDEESENSFDTSDDDDCDNSGFRESSRDSYNYEEDTFNALTDGQYGDYEDFKEGGGDLDYLRDCLGY